MDAVSEQVLPTAVPERRSFAELHRDVWRVVRSAPWIFVALPAVLWLPFDLVLEWKVASMPPTVWGNASFYLRYGQIGNAVAGTFISSVFLAALLDLSVGRRPTTLRALGEGFRLWAIIFAVWVLVGFLVSVGLICLVIPGLVVAVRYSLALPAVVFERVRPTDALEASALCVRRGLWSIVFGVCGAGLLYLPLMALSLLFVPGAAAPWLHALAMAPGNVIASFLMIGLTLLYADLRDGPALAAPVGSGRDLATFELSAQEASAKRGVVNAVRVSVGSLVLGGAAFFLLVLGPVSDGDAAWERDEYREALGHYERALYWDPTDAYAYYSISFCHQMLGELDEALVAIDKAIELESEDFVYQIGRAWVFARMGRVHDARSALRSAGRLEGADAAAIEALEEFLANPPQERRELDRPEPEESWNFVRNEVLQRVSERT